ncbi:MAG TPA: acyclic terpene utilization AtuA family protein [Kribbella sp.]|uniref:acyclic terpene utilization AtuA family protein n=1 Tax=Kribbella sp. TaxID=1871183 RepID=UPI002D775448|nr:acyclic terpene utilization AtuA family protein [Kribbella sp.]HET6298625.1 acyclic terpene utilization AtuA family protein [Kribbella sp.]
MSKPIRIGNASGFYGDRFSAFQEMVTGGPLDVVTGDYLAELTMLILGRDRLKDPSLGYAKTFLKQLEAGLGEALDRNISVVSNAGGLNPAGLAEAIQQLADKLGLHPKIAYVEGDDLLPRVDELDLGKPLTANAYLGAWGIAEALQAGADVVVTGRVTDASVIVGPAAAHHGWKRDQYDELAGAVIAGHVIECGCQATGGNYAFFHELRDLGRPGFPIAEIHADGSSVITKHDGTGGAVTIDTVKAQLLYEITGARYAGPDVTARVDSVQLEEIGLDRIQLSGVQGEPPPPKYKVSLNAVGGYRNEIAFVLTGLELEAKADLVKDQLERSLRTKPAELKWTVVWAEKPNAETEEQASVKLRCEVKDPDPKVVGRGFSSAAVELALSSYPGFHVTAPPGDGAPYGVFTAGFVDAGEVSHVVVLPDGTRKVIEPAAETQPLVDAEDAGLPMPLPQLVAAGRPARSLTREVPLGRVAGARSGDKGGDANVGVWVRNETAWRWLAHTLTVELFQELLPETRELVVTRHVLPNLWALNFVVKGLLGEGVASQARFDPQAKAVGEWLRSRYVDVPEVLL